MDKIRFAIIFFGSLVLLFILAIGVYFFRSHLLNKEYPDLSNNNSLNDTVVDVIRDARASARVTFESKEKYSLPWAKNFQYEIDNLPRMVMEGDILIKKEKSDTIILRRDNKDYIFVAYKSIN
jgi:hypothetical protein